LDIQTIFNKDITRKINGVVKADQLQEAVVWQELEEYVVAQDVKGYLDKFFGNFVESVRNETFAVEANGVWISGFFGSGKSHFLKILSYILGRDSVSSDGSTKSPFNFFEEKPQCNDPMLLANMKAAIDTPADAILFNIDSKSDVNKGKDAILKVFVNVFNELCGYSPEYPHLANIERELDQQGLFRRFQDEYQAVTGSSWLDKRKAYRLKIKQAAQALANTLDQNPESMEHWLMNKDGSFILTIENFATWVDNYLEQKDKKHKVFFLVDEIGQYIGRDSDLMLNLQTITENLGTICDGRAWVIVTSQEDIDKVIGELTYQEEQDFSKIQARFLTRISLASTKTDEIIQNRLLEKINSAKSSLTSIYESKGDILKNQLSFINAGMTLDSFRSEEEFIDHYPFAPYQYKLIQRIFQKLRDFKVTGGSTSRGERSMLKAFQDSAKLVKDQKIGILVPLWRFYPAIEETLDTVIKKTIIDADQNETLSEFDAQLLRTLFLIRYVEEIPGTVDNLITLTIDTIDADRLAIRRQIEESVQKLEKETLISRTGDEYFFLTNEERDITNEIKGIKLDAGESTRVCSNLIFSDLLNEFDRFQYPVNKKIFYFNRICDGQFSGSARERPLALSIVTPLADDYSLWTDETRCTLQSVDKVIVRLPNSARLYDDLVTYIKTEKYLKRDHSNVKPGTKVIIDRLKSELGGKKKGLKDLLEELLLKSECFAASKKLEISATAPKAVIEEVFTYFVKNQFRKLGYLEVLAKDSKELEKEIKTVLLRKSDYAEQIETTPVVANEKALEEIQSRLKIRDLKQETIVLKEEIENFAGIPYGWPEGETALLYARLIAKGVIELMADAQVTTAEKTVDILLKSSLWGNAIVRKTRKPPEEYLKKARKIANDVFETTFPSSENELDTAIREKLGKWQNDLLNWEKLAKEGNPGVTRIEEALKLISPILNQREALTFFEKFINLENEFITLSDLVYELENFYRTQKPVWNQLRQALFKFKDNETQLNEDSEIANALEELKAIADNENPFKKIKNIPALISKVDSKNNDLISEVNKRVLSEIDTAISTVSEALKPLDPKPDGKFTNRCLSPLHQLKKKLDDLQSIPHLEFEAERSKELLDDALVLIEEYQGVEPIEKVDVKPSKALKGKTYLESKIEVDDFLDELRKELETVIEAGKRIRII